MPPNSYDLSLEYARADFNGRARFDSSGPSIQGRGRVGVALALYSARPSWITTGLDNFNTGTANARPVGVARNSAEGPGYADLDLRWSRELPLKPGAKTRPSAVVEGSTRFQRAKSCQLLTIYRYVTSPFRTGHFGAGSP